MFLDDIINAKIGTVPAFHQFMLNYRARHKHIHAFFEGDDDSSIYCDFIRKVNPGQLQLYIYYCGGKTGVFDTYAILHRQNNYKTITLFFVDKDLSDLIPETNLIASNIFITKYYSIENYLVTEEMVRIILIELLHFRNADDDIDRIKTQFKKSLKSFYDAALPLMAWILHQNRIKSRPNLQGINCDNIFGISADFDITSIEISKLIPLIDKYCNTKTPASFFGEYPKLITELPLNNAKIWVRGKFELWFLVKFINVLVVRFNENSKSAFARIKMLTPLNTNNAIEILGPRLSMCKDIEGFLAVNLNIKPLSWRSKVIRKLRNFIFSPK
jgi:hypothetical protein